MLNDPDVPALRTQAAQRVGHNYASLIAPLIWEGRGIGIIWWPMRPGSAASAPRSIALLKTFADQAVIAIQNARLFNETQEALAHQTASADILRVISSSPTDVQPVFEAIVGTAVKHLGCDLAAGADRQRRHLLAQGHGHPGRADAGAGRAADAGGPGGQLPVARDPQQGHAARDATGRRWNCPRTSRCGTNSWA